MLIDILFLLVMVAAVIRGISKGFVVGIVSLFAIIIGLAAALKLSVVVAGFLRGSLVSGTRWVPLISFVLVLLVVLLLVGILARVIRKVISFALLGWLDSLAGIVLYICIYTIIFSIFLFYADKLSLISSNTMANSGTFSYVEPWGPKVIGSLGKIVPIFKNMFADLEAFFGDIARKAA